jgi:hypothetical protein
VSAAHTVLQRRQSRKIQDLTPAGAIGENTGMERYNHARIRIDGLETDEGLNKP